MSTLKAVPPIRLRHLVAAEVRAEMARQQITQVQLSKAIGMSQQSLSERLRGKTPFTTDDLEEIADALGVNAAKLLGGAQPSGNGPNGGGSPTPWYPRRSVTKRDALAIIQSTPAHEVSATAA